MTDSLQDLKKELEKSLRRYKKKVALLSSAESSSNSGKSAKRKAQALLQKTENQLQQLTALLNSERRDVFILDDPHTTSSSLLQHKNQMFIERKTARPEQSKSVDNDSTGNGDNKRHDNGNDGRIRSIVILVAMEEEARPFLERHNLVENTPSPFQPGSSMRCYSGTISSLTGDLTTIHLVWNGRCKVHSCNLVATTAAGVAAYAAVQVFKPDLVISAGTAGGFGELGACVGDVYISTKCIFHARRIPICLPSTQDEALENNISTFRDKYFEEYGFGHFRSPPLSVLAKSVGVKQGIVSSSDCLDCTEMDLQLLRSEGAVVKEMEAAAAAWVCQELGRPFFALKSITDIVDGAISSEEEFYSNLSLASARLQEKLSLVVMHLGGSSLDVKSQMFVSTLSQVPTSSSSTVVNAENKRNEGSVGAGDHGAKMGPDICGREESDVPVKESNWSSFNGVVAINVLCLVMGVTFFFGQRKVK